VWKLGFPKVGFCAFSLWWEVMRALLVISRPFFPHPISVLLILYRWQVVACDWSAPGLEYQLRGLFCSFSPFLVLLLLFLTHLFDLPGTFALFDNLWDSHNTIPVRKFSFGTRVSVLAGV
jgi:hypothetical protein